MLIKDLNHLKRLCKGRTQLDTFVAIGGWGRSSKTPILQEDDTITVYNDIDDTVQHFRSLETMIKCHATIKEALQKKAFFVYDYEVKK